MRDSLMKSLGNYCSFSRGGLVVSLQYRHYQTSLVALTMSWERKKERDIVQCSLYRSTGVIQIPDLPLEAQTLQFDLYLVSAETKIDNI